MGNHMQGTSLYQGVCLKVGNLGLFAVLLWSCKFIEVHVYDWCTLTKKLLENELKYLSRNKSNFFFVQLLNSLYLVWKSNVNMYTWNEFRMYCRICATEEGTLPSSVPRKHIPLCHQMDHQSSLISGYMHCER